MARARIAALMFLQFASWGAWAPVLGRHLEGLGFSPPQVGAVYGTAALGALLSPLVAGQGAGRWFATARLLAAAFAGAGGLLWVAADADAFRAVWWACLGAMVCFAPTLGLANSLAFHHLRDARADFPVVRVWGTVGWIAAGAALSAWVAATER